MICITCRGKIQKMKRTWFTIEVVCIARQMMQNGTWSRIKVPEILIDNLLTQNTRKRGRALFLYLHCWWWIKIYYKLVAYVFIIMYSYLSIINRRNKRDKIVSIMECPALIGPQMSRLLLIWKKDSFCYQKVLKSLFRSDEGQIWISEP